MEDTNRDTAPDADSSASIAFARTAVCKDDAKGVCGNLPMEVALGSVDQWSPFHSVGIAAVVPV